MSIAQDLPVLQKKENVVQDFALNHTESQDLLDYKFIYTYSIKDLNGNPRTILLQNIVLSTSEEGNVQHVLGIHTDVTHLKLAASDTLSIIHMKGGTSYYNVSVEDGSFSIENASRKARAFPELTSREKEVTRCFARGLSADQVSKELDISYHTVRTHRNNLLKKCNCSNTTELVAQCLAAGVIGV